MSKDEQLKLIAKSMYQFSDSEHTHYWFSQCQHLN